MITLADVRARRTALDAQESARLERNLAGGQLTDVSWARYATLVADRRRAAERRVTALQRDVAVVQHEAATAADPGATAALLHVRARYETHIQQHAPAWAQTIFHEKMRIRSSQAAAAAAAAAATAAALRPPQVIAEASPAVATPPATAPAKLAPTHASAPAFHYPAAEQDDIIESSPAAPATTNIVAVNADSDADIDPVGANEAAEAEEESAAAPFGQTAPYGQKEGGGNEEEHEATRSSQSELHVTGHDERGDDTDGDGDGGRFSVGEISQPMPPLFADQPSASSPTAAAWPTHGAEVVAIGRSFGDADSNSEADEQVPYGEAMADTAEVDDGLYVGDEPFSAGDDGEFSDEAHGAAQDNESDLSDSAQTASLPETHRPPPPTPAEVLAMTVSRMLNTSGGESGSDDDAPAIGWPARGFGPPSDDSDFA